MAIHLVVVRRFVCLFACCSGDGSVSPCLHICCTPVAIEVWGDCRIVLALVLVFSLQFLIALLLGDWLRAALAWGWASLLCWLLFCCLLVLLLWLGVCDACAASLPAAPVLLSFGCPCLAALCFKLQCVLGEVVCLERRAW